LVVRAATEREARRATIRRWVGSCIGLAFAGALWWAPPLAAQVIITGLADIPLGRWNGQSDLQGEDSHCVLAPRGGKFNIEATGDGPGNTFVLHNGAFTLPYQVSYDDGSGWNRMTAGVPLTGQRGQPNQNQLERCLSGRRSPERVRVRVLARDLGAAIAGGYSGRLTLLVAAE
jgi:hypothetical protein